MGSSRWERSPANLSQGADSPLNVRIYAVDTCNGWVSAACCSAQDFERMHVHAQGLQPHAQLYSQAGRRVRKESVGRPRAGQGSLLECLKLVGLALSASNCFSEASPLGIAGHWFYLVYQTFDASVVCRSAFWGAQTPGLLDSELVHAVVAQLIAHDLSQQNESSLAVTLKQRGGACVDARYQRGDPPQA